MTLDLELGAYVCDAVEVAVEDGGGSHAGCYRTSTRGVRCWGGSNVALNFTGPMPGPWTVPLPGAATGLAGWGRGHCAILMDETVRCWRGVGGHVGVTDPGVRGVVALAGGSDHVCALDRDGAVWCWGVSALTPPVATTEAMLAAVRPAEVPVLRGAKALALGDEALFAIDVEGRLVRAELGPAGVSAVGVEGAPTHLDGLAAGGSWACGIASGTVWCAGWGRHDRKPVYVRHPGARGAPAPGGRPAHRRRRVSLHRRGACRLRKPGRRVPRGAAAGLLVAPSIGRRPHLG